MKVLGNRNERLRLTRGRHRWLRVSPIRVLLAVFQVNTPWPVAFLRA